MRDYIEKKPACLVPSAIRDVGEYYTVLRAHRKLTALLESLGAIDDDTSRYCFVGAFPVESLVARGTDGILTDLSGGTSRRVPHWWREMTRFTRLCAQADADGPYQTGTIGYVGYDAKHDFEKLERRIAVDQGVPDVFLVRYAVVLILDRVEGRAWWAADAGYEAEAEALEALRDESPDSSTEFRVLGDIAPDFERDEYLGWVRRTIEYIRAGDIFQANITARFSGRYEGDAYTLYRRLRRDTPNPFFTFLDFPDQVISTSPERFFSIRGSEITTHPIKGTIRCEIGGIDQRDTLALSAKDRAENTMITDLMRNDIGRVCEHGSVTVRELCNIKRFNQLYHLESVISGSLRPGADIGGVIAAVFPGGSITGAPKIRAMEIIEELENRRRGPYCGMIGFFGSEGWVDTSIAIRTLYASNGQIYLHSGGGIVIGSHPESEHAELMLKAERMLLSLDHFNVLRRFRE